MRQRTDSLAQTAQAVMMTRRVSDELTSAYAKVRHTWAVVAGRLPGMPDHDAEAWQRWLVAVRLANLLSGKVANLGVDGPSGHQNS